MANVLRALILALEVAACAAHARGRECCAPNWVRTELADLGFPRTLATVKRLRARLSLKCRHRRRFVCTTDSNQALPIAPNLLEQRFDQAAAPNQIWVTDITYVPTDEGWLRPTGRKRAPMWQQSRICLPRRSSVGQWRITCEPSWCQKRCGYSRLSVSTCYAP